MLISVTKVFRSVSVGEQMTREFMMFSVGVPLPPDHMPKMFSILLERIWRVYRMHPEFEEMPTQLQVSISNSFVNIEK